MSKMQTIIHGIVRNGVVVPEDSKPLPEGLRVDIVFDNLPPELQSEFEEWEAASDQDMIHFEEGLKQENNTSA